MRILFVLLFAGLSFHVLVQEMDRKYPDVQRPIKVTAMENNVLVAGKNYCVCKAAR